MSASHQHCCGCEGDDSEPCGVMEADERIEELERELEAVQKWNRQQAALLQQYIDLNCQLALNNRILHAFIFEMGDIDAEG